MSDRLRGNDEQHTGRTDPADRDREFYERAELARELERVEERRGEREFRAGVLGLLESIRDELVTIAQQTAGRADVDAERRPVPSAQRLARSAYLAADARAPVYLARVDAAGAVLERGVVCGEHAFAPDHCEVCYSDVDADRDEFDKVEHTAAELLARLDGH